MVKQIVRLKEQNLTAKDAEEEMRFYHETHEAH